MGPSCDGTIPMFLLSSTYSVVVKMKKTEPQKGVSLTRKVLRLFGMDRGFEKPSSNLGGIAHVSIPANNHYNYLKEIQTARLEAERRKAEAILEWQKRRFIC